MDITSGLRLRHLPHGSVHPMGLQAHSGLAVFEGRLWITRSGDRRDYIVEAGDTFWSEPPAEILAQALADSKFVELHAVGVPDARPDVLPARRLSAYELTRVARDMRHREVARSLVRAAGAVSYLLHVAWQMSLRIVANVGGRQPVGPTRRA